MRKFPGRSDERCAGTARHRLAVLLRVEQITCLTIWDRPERANHVWSYDFGKAMTHDGRMLRLLV